MIKNYLKMSLRTLKKQKGFSFINLSGLGIGMACCILIMLFVRDELSYDTYHEKADRIYRLVVDAEVGGNLSHFAIPPFAAAPAFQSEIPEIENFVRLMSFSSQATQVLHEDKKFEETGIFGADSTFFEIFSYDFITGDPETALDEPGSLVITESTAKRLFGDDDPLGKVVTIPTINIGANRVTGVIKDVPLNSHFTFNYIVSFTAVPPANRGFLRQWLSINGWTYLLLKDGTDTDALVAKFPDIVERNTGQQARGAGIKLEFFVEKMTDIYLNSTRQAQIGAMGNLTYVYTFATIAIFILVIACINFMNLSTARSAARSKEVGLRKVFGAYKNQLVSQFLSESVVMSVTGMVLALILVLISLPAFNGLAGKSLAMDSLNDVMVWLTLLGLIVFTGIIAGSYPAFFLSAFKPISVLRGHLSKGSGSSAFRRILVVLQFSISIILIISTMIVLEQIDFMKNKNLGFDKEQVMVIRMQNPAANRSRTNTIRNELQQNPNVVSVAFSSTVPGRGAELRLFLPEGANPNDTHAMSLFRVDHSFIDTYQMTMASGRDFSRELLSDTASAFILNEAAANAVGWTAEEAINKDFEFARARQGKVIGVLRDFHFTSLRNQINPLVIMIAPQVSLASVRIKANNVSETVNFLREAWMKFEPDQEFSYSFIDESFATMYQTEERLSDIFKTFAALAILIACLGLFGLASFTAEQRRKEIGIRKVLGESVDGIVVRLSKDFTIWVVVANIIAWPVTYYVISNYWLSNFPYKASLNMFTFIAAGIVSLLIALVTVAYQSISAALTNPVNSLRDE